MRIFSHLGLKLRMAAGGRAKLDSAAGAEGGRGVGVVSLFRRHPMPLWMGFAFIGYMEWRRIRRRQLEKAGDQENIPAEVRNYKNVPASHFILMSCRCRAEFKFPGKRIAQASQPGCPASLPDSISWLSDLEQSSRGLSRP